MDAQKRRRLFRCQDGANATVLNWHNSPGDEFRFYARSFRKAAKTLAETWELDRSALTDWDACPIVFLYRHAVELYLKGLLLGDGANFLSPRPSRRDVLEDHSLKRLMPHIRSMFSAVGWGGELDPDGIQTFGELESLISELHDVDTKSYTFRYPTTKQGDGSLRSHFTFSATQFAALMEQICAVLEGATVGLPEEWAARAELAVNEANHQADWEE